jgi:DNA (cytosine-5)-methyltransferase 1
MTTIEAPEPTALVGPVERGVMPRRAPRCLDLFCGAGGAGMGLHRAGFEVVGVDINPQPYYPFTFRQGDALDADLSGFDLVWASPPCQAYTEMQRMHKNSGAHKDLVAPMRAKLQAWGGLWIMENVAGSPLRESLMLCGSMFGLRIAKHRFFEANFELPLLMPPCDHRDLYDPWHGKGRTADKMREAQGTPWMPSSGGASRKRGETGDTNNAIPPAYSEFLGSHALVVIAGHNVANNRIPTAPQD